MDYDTEPDARFRLLNEEVGQTEVKEEESKKEETTEGQDFSGLEGDAPVDDGEVIDNLAEHVIGSNKADGDAAKGMGQKKQRKLTTQEGNELRGTTIMKARKTIAIKEITFEDFDFKMVIGRGTFGKVFLVE